MPSDATDESLAEAVIQNVEHGAYPESEKVISADLPASAYPKLLASIEKARDEVKEDVRALSKGAAPDVDTWIAQAKQLQADIEHSKVTAQEIIQQAEAGGKLQQKADDAANKARLLRSELAFNESLANTLQQVKNISGKLDEVQAQVTKEQLIQSANTLQAAVDATKELDQHENTRFTGLLHNRIARLGAEVREHAMSSWSRTVVVEKAKGTIKISQDRRVGTPNGIDTITAALGKLNVQDDVVDQLYKDIDTVILRNWLAPSATVRLASGGDVITTNASSRRTSADDRLDEARVLLDFLHTRLPSDITMALSKKLVPELSNRLIDDWMVPAVPLSVDGIDEFQTLLDHALEFSEHANSLGLDGAELLGNWVDEAPRVWLSRRKEAALAAIRASSFRNLGIRKVVERVETQMVSDDHHMLNTQPTQDAEKTGDDWDDNWDDEEEKPTSVEHADEEDDSSAWDVNEATNDEEQTNGAAEDESGDAWGWGEADNASQPASPVATRQQTLARPRLNGVQSVLHPKEREMTLKESYTVTGIPDSLMELIIHLIGDAEKLSDHKFAESPIAPAARGLFSVPPLVLGMYRATAAAYYAKDPAGNMLLYNDCSRLSEALTKLAARSASDGIGRLRLDSDINLLNRFGKLAYGREMEAQRTVLRDLLDGAQGFTNCTVQPFARECEDAVSMTLDRVREVKKQWDGILSPSALLQSLGNLASTVCAKLILDIEEMSDISEDESKALSGYIAKVTTLSELFVQSSPEGDGQHVDMTGVYTPNWFKFQYLGEILESRLADIKYLWQEGELSLEYDVDEVVDLIEALFADSDYRRNAIRDIRAST